MNKRKKSKLEDLVIVFGIPAIMVSLVVFGWSSLLYFARNPVYDSSNFMDYVSGVFPFGAVMGLVFSIILIFVAIMIKYGDKS